MICKNTTMLPQDRFISPEVGLEVMRLIYEEEILLKDLFNLYNYLIVR